MTWHLAPQCDANSSILTPILAWPEKKSSENGRIPFPFFPLVSNWAIPQCAIQHSCRCHFRLVIFVRSSFGRKLTSWHAEVGCRRIQWKRIFREEASRAFRPLTFRWCSVDSTLEVSDKFATSRRSMQFCVTASSSSCEMRPLRDMQNVGLIANLNSLRVSVSLWTSFSLFGLFSELRSLVARAPSLRRGMVMHTSIAEDPTSSFMARDARTFSKRIQVMAPWRVGVDRTQPVVSQLTTSSPVTGRSANKKTPRR